MPGPRALLLHAGMHPDASARLERALVALDGLSVGDAFGERFFLPPALATARIYDRAVPAGELRWTDDTAMALAIVEVLRARDDVDPDALALAFARRYRAEPNRGYGGTAHEILAAIAAGEPWRDVAAAPFGGQGSMGNGGGMRAAPVGAYFAVDPPEVVVRGALRSAQPTHAHPDGQAGAVAVALAAAHEARRRVEGRPPGSGAELLAFVLAHTPNGPTREGVARAAELLHEGSSSLRAAEELGSGSRVVSSDTVPFALFCAASHLGRFEEAIWATLEGLGDRDTTCAMVGGIVASGTGREGIPADWLARREALR